MNSLLDLLYIDDGETIVRNSDIKLILGDSKIQLGKIQSDSIDLVFTSPPYAERRKSTYGGIPAGKYVDWFLPIAEEIKRVLKPTGSFF